MDGGVLRLELDGEAQTPTANEVYDLVFGGGETFRGRACAPGKTGGISFSRYPARLIMTLRYGDGPDGAALYAVPSAVAGEYRIDLPGGGQPDIDQVIVGSRWYPLATGALDHVKQQLGRTGALPGRALSLRQYLELRKMAGSEDWIEDETGEGKPPVPAELEQRTEEALVSFRGNLYPYQRDGWRWLTYIWQEGLGAILADEMGLGKTIQVIALLASPERDAAAPSMIVAPTTLLENWRREIGKFAHGLRVIVHQGADRSGDYRTLCDADVVITSYETVVRDSSMFAMIDWRIVVLDEAQAIKNPDTKRTQAM